MGTGTSPSALNLQKFDTSTSQATVDVEQGPDKSSSGVTVIIKDLTYAVASNSEKGKQVKLLSDVSCFIAPSRLTALMGPSGSGKTTLLNVISGRTTAAYQGQVLFGGMKPTQAYLQRYTGMVEQFDTLIPQLTVYEMLMYTAELKRPFSESAASKREAVEKLLARLGLTPCKDVPIGDPLNKGISGGQAKRTNIGIALIAEPKVLFLDEPTSGLDSHTSNDVMELIKGFTADNVTICATIHSPSAYAFSLFDNMLMLVRGQVVFFGPQGDAAISFARSHWPKHDQRHAEYSAAEYLVDMVTEADKRGHGSMMSEIYEKSDLRKANDAQLQSYLLEAAPAEGSDLARELAVKSSTSTPWWWGIVTLLKYRSTRNYRDPNWLGSRLGDKIIFSLIILTLYLRIGDDFSQGNLVNITSSLFMWATLPTFGAAAYVPAIVLERKLFYRERSDGLYHVITYLVAKIIEELVLACVVSIILSAYVFAGVQYQGSFGYFWLIYFVTLCNGIVLGYFMASLCPNIDVANAALPTYCVTLLFFAGQLITYSTMPRYWKWYSYIDWVRYAWGALVKNHFNDGRDVQFTSDGQTLLEYYGLVNVDISAYIGYLSLFFVTFFILAYLTLSFVNHQKR